MTGIDIIRYYAKYTFDATTVIPPSIFITCRIFLESAILFGFEDRANIASELLSRRFDDFCFRGLEIINKLPLDACNIVTKINFLEDIYK